MLFLPGDVAKVLQLLISVIGPTEARPECRKCSVACDATQEGLVHYHETWDSEAAFRLHAQSQEFWRVLTAMDLCVEEPKVVVGNLSGHVGMAHLRALRSQLDESDIKSDIKIEGDEP